jgi:apolipoprotein D and lipocalin family protein
MKITALATFAAFPFLLLVGCATTSRAPGEPITVASVDLKRYAGNWHEIARFPNWFQRGCAGDVTATYTLNPDGTIKVDNRCVDKNGGTKQSVGTARAVPGSNGSKLKVSFFWPFTGDYWILDLDEEHYDWALVGSPSREYLWILARKKSLPAATYERIVASAVAKGFDVKKLKKTEQL